MSGLDETLRRRMADQPASVPPATDSSTEPERRTPDEWLSAPEFAGTHVVDPDGWRGRDALAWDTPLTRVEFARRLSVSTITRPVEQVPDA